MTLMATIGALTAFSGLGAAGEPLPAPDNPPLTQPVIVPDSPAATPNVPLADSSIGTSGPTASASMAGAALSATTAAGRTPGTFAVANSGSASYTIPLWTPPGVGNVDLKLALVYNSRAGNGVLGQGWSLSGLSAISRCNKTWAQDGTPSAPTNTVADRFCLDGQQLKLVSGTYGVAGSVYATEIESFSRIVATGTTGSGPTSFTVTTRNGLVYDYGTTTDSQIFAGTTGSIRTWALSRIRDRASVTDGNSIALSYINEAQNGNYMFGTHRIASISYPTTASGQGPFYSVLFSYSPRSIVDVPTGYQAGSVVKELNQLNTITIQTYGAGTTIKSYNLSYAQGGSSQRLRLTAVQECSAANCLAPTTIQYQDGTKGWSSTLSSVGATISNAAGVGPIPLDLNGDGLADLVYPVVATSSSSRWWAKLASAAGYGSPIDTGVTTTNTSRRLVASFDGKGLAQLLMEQSGSWYVVSYNGSGFSVAATGVAVNGEFSAVDYDGDGLPDLASLVGDSQIQVRRNTTVPPGAVTFAATPVTVRSSFNFYQVDTAGSLTSFADFNGDGRADLLIGSYIDDDTGRSYRWNVLESNGLGGAQATVTQLQGSFDHVPLPGDWNGDGCTDIVSGYRLYISKCGGGFQWQDSPGLFANSNTMTADWDGDGRVDLLYTTAPNYNWYVRRSTGAGMAAAEPTGTAAPSGTAWFVFDADGDGLVDLGYRDTSNQLQYRVHAGAGVPPDLATSFTDGFGMNQSPSYKSISIGNYSKYADAVFPEVDFSAPLYVVDQFTASTGTDTTYQNQFWYYGARLHLQGRGFEGFYAQRIYDTRNSLYTYDYVHRQFPYTGMHIQRLVRQQDTTTAVSTWVGTPNVQSLGTGIEQRKFPFIASATDSRYEYGGTLNGALITEISTTNTYGDGYGNPTQVLTTVTDKDPTSPYLNSAWQSTVSTTFSNDTANHCLGLPTVQTTTHAVPGQTTRTRTANFSVDASHCRISQQVLQPSTAALKVTTTLGFDTCGNVNSVQVVGANSSGSAMPARTTSFAYGTRCQLPETVTNALGQSTALAYDYAFGVPTQSTDPNLLATLWQYDDFGRRTRETRPDGTMTVWSFESCTTGPCWGLPDLRFLVYETPVGSDSQPVRSRALFYDGFDRLRYDESNRVLGTWTNEVYYYDALGRVVFQYLPHASNTIGYRTWSYDALGRVTAERLYQTSGTLDRSTTLAYTGRTTSITDPLSRTRSQVHDVLGRLRRVIDPSPGGTTSYNYDAFGNLNRVQDPIGAVSTGSYNLRGFRTQWADVDRGTWNFTGNSLNELVGWTNAKGQSFSAVYDKLGRRTSRTEPEGTSTWTWGDTAALHEIGRLRSVTGYGYTDERNYDAAGRLAQTKITTDAPYVFDYTYNSIGALDTLTYPTSPVPSGQSGSRFKIRYDYSYGAPYRIRDITDTAERTLWKLNTVNDFSSPTSETLGTNLVAVTSGYTPWTNELTSVQSGVGGAANRQNLAYQWDSAGNLAQRQDLTQGLTETFTADALDRVQSVTGNAAPNLTLAYDASGNLTSKSDVGSYSYHATRKHAVTAAGGNSYGYDANGNVITRNGLSQTWASFDLPTLLRSDSYQSQLSYGPQHQRWKQVATYSNGTETTHYVGGRLEKMTATSTPTLVYWRHYVPTPGGATIVVSRNLNSGGANSGSTTYALTDHLGSSEALLDGSSGAYIVRESFDTFGRRRGSNWNAGTAPDWAAIGNTTRDGYTGHEMLDSVGTIHMNGRVYDPTVGRFLSVDPLIGDLGDSQSVNPYAYVGNRPLSYTDPTGYDAGCVSLGWCGFLIGSVTATLQNFLFGSSRPMPPPATAIPGQSAQNGVGLCGPGSSSPTCGGMILYAGAPSGDSGVPSSNWVTSDDADFGANARFLGEPSDRAAAAGLFWARDPNIPTSIKLGIPLVVAIGTGGVLFCISDAPLCALIMSFVEVASAPNSDVPLIGGGVVGPKLGSAAKSASRVSNTAREIEDWLGPGAKTIRNDADDLVAVSRDGTRRVRFDVNRPYPHENPHGHVEELVNGRWVKSGPIFPRDVTPK